MLALQDGLQDLSFSIKNQIRTKSDSGQERAAVCPRRLILPNLHPLVLKKTKAYTVSREYPYTVYAFFRENLLRLTRSCLLA